jgi:hypothetical protein
MVDTDLFREYVAQGFVPQVSSWAAFAANHSSGGVGNVNLQMATSHAGLELARSLGATHAIKVRADVRVTQPRLFIECVLGVASTVQVLTMWIGSVRYAVEHLVAGPLEEVATYFRPPYKDEAVDGRFPEQYLMEEYARKKSFPAEAAGRYANFCSRVDFFFPRLPPGVYYFDHKGYSDDRDMSRVHSECWSGARGADGACALQPLEEARLFETEC